METGYTSDIQYVMDFMKLAEIFNSDKASVHQKNAILLMEKALYETLPVAQSNRMSRIHSHLHDIIKKHDQMLEIMHKNLNVQNMQRQQMSRNVSEKDEIAKDKKKEHFIIFFYSSKCGACKKVMADWKTFTSIHHDSNFTILEYDSTKPEDMKTFETLHITTVPTIVKLNLDVKTPDYLTTLKGDINIRSLLDFAHF